MSNEPLDLFVHRIVGAWALKYHILMTQDALDAIESCLIDAFRAVKEPGGVDYRELLRKYMAEVMACEGISFIGDAYPPLDDPYTDAELAALRAIEQDVRNTS